MLAHNNPHKKLTTNFDKKIARIRQILRMALFSFALIAIAHSLRGIP